MIKNFNTKYEKAMQAVLEKAVEVMHSIQAVSQSTETMLLVVLVVALVGAFFAPQITAWFGDVMADLATHTDNIFNYTASSAQLSA
ncbi:MAG: hypothetical protein R3Y27_05620 [Clostridia bacterium]